MRKVRTKFRSGTVADTKKRNEKMFKRFEKLMNNGNYGKMEIYEMLAKEFNIAERNSVYNIINGLKQQTI